MATVIQASQATDGLEDAAVAHKEPQASDRELVAKLVEQCVAEVNCGEPVRLFLKELFLRQRQTEPDSSRNRV
ncbi:hypothetical protein [Microtetraspora sp. NBRC 16547]|uniref:hypothetical protein n=1 Tax=Microtetraspora sp. NBRC 16547 TaxID=3030993 RepID=UPI0024A35AA6|nr:hypothetical protein [Microtetraspora sp. NBRC 16547]GLW96853.1 hypothetical protein Misp02_09400 [Microtetraspora sp. NBRC 16547]